MSVSLHAIAPRLARARDAWIAAERRRDRRRRELTTQLLELERLVAHRDLQLVRAGHTRDRRYIAERHRKLAAAERSRDRIRKRLDRLDRRAA